VYICVYNKLQQNNNISNKIKYYSAIKNEILPFATMWMDLEGIALSEISQKRQITYGFTHMWCLRNKTNKGKKRNRKDRLSNTENNLVVTGGGGWGVWEIHKGDWLRVHTYQDEPWVTYKIVAALYNVLETNITLYVWWLYINKRKVVIMKNYWVMR